MCDHKYIKLNDYPEGDYFLLKCVECGEETKARVIRYDTQDEKGNFIYKIIDK
jgi:hypothetical protein